MFRHSMPNERIELAAVAQSGGAVARRNTGAGTSGTLSTRRNTVASGTSSTKNHRAQKTTYLLVTVVVVFMCAWFPLNFLNVLLDLGLYKSIFR